MNDSVYEKLSIMSARAFDLLLRCLYALALIFHLDERRDRQARSALSDDPLLIKNLTKADFRRLDDTNVDFEILDFGITLEWCDLPEVLEALDLYEVTYAIVDHGETTYVEMITRPVADQSADRTRLTILALTEPTLLDQVAYLYRGTRPYDHPTRQCKRERRFAVLAGERLRASFPGAVAVHLDGETGVLPGDCLNVILSGEVVEDGAVPDKLFGIELEERDDAPVFSDDWDFVIRDPESEHPIGALSGNKLVIFAGLYSSKDEDESVVLLDAILQACAEQIDLERVICSAARGVLKLTKESALPASIDGAVTTMPDGFSFGASSAVDRLVDMILAPVMAGTKVEITHSDHGSSTDGCFHIFYDQYVSSNATVKPPSQFWGYPVPPKQHAYQPSGRGYLILSNNGFPVGELFDDCLYVFLSLIEDVTESEIKLFARFLMEVRLLMQGLENGAKTTVGDEEAFLRRAQESLDQSADTENLIAEAVTLALRQSGAQLAREIVSVRRFQSDYFNFNGFAERELAAEFDAIVQMPKVLGIAITKDYVVVTTGLIYCVNPKTKKRHEMGSFTIDIPFDPKGEISWNNRTGSVIASGGESFFHPHIKANGKACITKATLRTITQLITSKNFFGLVELLIVYLESVDMDDDWGKYIGNWPLANNQG